MGRQTMMGRPMMAANSGLARMVMQARMADDDVGEIGIYGVICNWAWDDYDTDSKQVRDALKAVAGAKKLIIHIFSPGGYVDDGMHMMDQIAAHGAREKHAIIEGACCSAATLLTLPCDKVSIYAGSEFMIHDPSGIVWGNPKDVADYADYLTKIAEDIAALYAKRTGGGFDEIRQMMRDETWMTAEEAVEHGFATEVLSPVATGASMCAGLTRGAMKMISDRFGYHHVPERLTSTLPEREAAQNTGSVAGAGAMNDIGPTKNQEGLTMLTMEELKTQQPDLYSQIFEEGRSAGMTSERERIRALDEITLDGFETMIADAKYGETPRSAADVSVDIVRAQMKGGQKARSQGSDFLNARRKETEMMQNVGGQAVEDEEGADDEAELKGFAQMANASLRK